MARTWQMTIAVLAVLAVLVGLIVGKAATTGPRDATIQIEGSTTVGPIAMALKEAIRRKRPAARITVRKTGSGDGAAALIDGRCDVATMSRLLRQQEFKAAVAKGVLPVVHVVAMDGLCVIVHETNSVEGLTTEQVRKIYRGAITNWQDVGGPDMAIVAITRDSSSGTYETFRRLVMGEKKMAGAVGTAASNPAVQARVRTTKGAIGYVGLAFLEGVKAIKIDGVPPSRNTIASEAFPLARPLLLVTNGYPKPATLLHALCTFHLTREGQMLIEAEGFVPLTNY